MKYIFLTEERSMKTFLDVLLRKNYPQFDFRTIHHEGKSDLKKSIPNKFGALNTDDTMFVILIDQDSSDCLALKSEINAICKRIKNINNIKYKVRIVCHELESWYLGDLSAIDKAFSIKPSKMQGKRKFRNPDKLANAKQELRRYIKREHIGQVETAEKIAGTMTISNMQNNRSYSFHVFLRTIGLPPFSTDAMQLQLEMD